MPSPRPAGTLRNLSGCALLASLLPAICSAQAHVSRLETPDWSEQIIYFAMIDRFADGDPGNNDQGAGEFNPQDGARYSGGDLAGLSNRLDYLRALGATALWITPPVSHQWWDPQVNYGGYHGYWGSDFSTVDPHFGDLDDYRTLANGLHQRGMYLIQDIVVNHVGNWFSYPDGRLPGDPAQGVTLKPDKPLQTLWQRNDPRIAGDREAAIYHWTPRIQDFRDRQQELNWQLAELDDLNTENPTVRAELRRNYAHWIREVGVDAYRVDTAFYVPPAFFRDFRLSEDPDAPGITPLAESLGQVDFFAFGEGFGIDAPFEDTATRKIASYLGKEAATSPLPSMINFPLYGSLLDVFARGQPAAVMQHRIASMLQHFPDPHRMPTFIDNHDVDRWLANGNEAGMKQALLALMTLPGIPTIYYGTEQGFRQPRAAMFAAGYQSQGRDHFDTNSPMFTFLREVIALRKQHRTLSQGRPEVVLANAQGPGVLAWRVQHGDAQMLVLFNTAEHPILTPPLPLGTHALRLRGVFGLQGQPKDQSVAAGQALALSLAARDAQVFVIEPGHKIVSTTADAAPTTNIDALASTLPAQRHRVSGDAMPGSAWQLLLDGRLDQAREIRANTAGRWQTDIDLRGFIDPKTEHHLQLWQADSQTLGAARTFRVDADWKPAGRSIDPPKDDHGPHARTVYPLDPAWRKQRPADLREIALATSGNALQIDITLASHVHDWQAPMGFDHLALTVFIELPERDGGQRVMPLQQGELPDSMRWHYRLRLHGWSNVLFAAEGADSAHEGRLITPGARLQVDASQARWRIEIPGAAIGNPDTLRGAKVWINTWDYDGGYRPLRDAAGGAHFGGHPQDAKWMDASAVITLL
jgi:glycosidase